MLAKFYILCRKSDKLKFITNLPIFIRKFKKTSLGSYYLTNLMNVQFYYMDELDDFGQLKRVYLDQSEITEFR